MTVHNKQYIILDELVALKVISSWKKSSSFKKHAIGNLEWTLDFYSLIEMMEKYKIKELSLMCRDFLGGLVTETLSSWCSGLSSIPGPGS